MKTMIDEFKSFIMKGDLVTIAVAFILGVQFSTVVTSFTDVIMGFVGAVVGKPSFNSLVLEIGDGEVPYGAFLTALVNFAIVAFVLFLVIKGYDKMKDRMGVNKAEDGPSEADLLAEIRDELKQQRSA